MLRLAAWLVVLGIAGCGTSTGSPTVAAEAPPPTERPAPSNRLTPRPSESQLAPVKVALHGQRSSALDAAAELGWTCGPEFELEDGNPAVTCTYPGGTGDEGLVVIGPADDLLAVRMHSDEGEKLADFLNAFASEEIADWTIGHLDEVIDTGIVPLEVSDRFGDAIVVFEVDEDLGMRLTIQADDV